MKHQLPRYIKSVLDESKLNWELEQRTKHRLLRIEGEAILILPHAKCKQHGRRGLNNIARLKRAVNRLQRKNA